MSDFCRVYDTLEEVLTGEEEFKEEEVVSGAVSWLEELRLKGQLIEVKYDVFNEL